MADRTDIDALLIGALYGELTPADEARLTAHLESHPADRTALADLTRTREAVRGSRLLAFQAEPPQAISALLLREASRRAPRPQRETTGWFQRFTRSFMAHPAMAAAATVVLVASVAGTFYLRGEDQLAVPVPKVDTAATSSLAPGPAPGPAPGTSADPTSEDRPSTEQPTAPATAPPATAPPAVAAEPAPQGQQKAAPLAGSAAADSYRVRLDEAGRAENRQRNQMVVVPSQAMKGEAAVGGKDAVAPTASPARAKMVKKPASIEVRTPERRIEPKELGDADDTGDLAKRNDRRDGAGASVAQRSHAGGGGPTGAASAPAPASPPAAAAVADQAPSPADATAGQRETAADAKKAAKPSPVAATPPPPPAPRPAPAASSNEDSSAPSSRRERGLAKEAKPARPVAPVARDDKADTTDKAANDKAADDKALLDWARKRKDQVIALVGSNNCRAAASAAGEIYHRAPDYYAANVVTDRSIRPCLAYLNSERDRQERAKAAKRAIQADDAARTK